MPAFVTVSQWWNRKHPRTAQQAATLDVARSAPPPSPLAPVELTNPAQVSAVMDVAARIGDILLSSGTSNRDTKTQIHAVTSAYGLHYCHVDITLNTITVYTTIGTDEKTPISVFRVVRRLSTDFSKLLQVDHLIRNIQAGTTPPDEADRILDTLFSTRGSYGFPVSMAAWGILGGAVSIMLGGTWLASLLAALLTMFVTGFNAVTRRRNLPTFFQYFFGGFLVTTPTAIIYHLTNSNIYLFAPSHVIAPVIVVLLAGLPMVQSIQDGITGAPVTAAARFFETFLLSCAVIGGVGMGISTAEFFGITLPALEPTAAAISTFSFGAILAGAIAAGAYVVACYAELSTVMVATCTGAIGTLTYYVMLSSTIFGPVIATATAATVVGIVGGLLARRFAIPPLITALAGIVPMLPGLYMYRAMYASLNEQMLVGITNFALALSVCCSLAAGVVLGEWIAYRLRRPPTLNFYSNFRKGLRTSFRQAQATSNQQATGSFPATNAD